MTKYNFDEIIDRTQHSSAKWSWFDSEKLPMWVADMDFYSPPSVVEAMKTRADHGIFGYTMPPTELKEAVVARMKKLYNWEITTDDIIFSPGMVTALNAVAKGFGKAGDAVLMQTPVYGPFLSAPGNNGKFAYSVDMDYISDGEHHFHYEMDYSKFERAASNPQTTMYFLCNPHNPGGFIYPVDELEKTAEICLKHNLMIVADEIHSDLILEGKQTPIAALSPEIAQNSITMIASSKTYNVPGESCSILIVPNEEKRKALEAALWSMGVHVSVLAFAAAQGAYAGGDEWLEELRVYLKGNRDFALQYIREHMPQIRTTIPQATYLLWMDMRNAGIEGRPFDFVLNEANIALSDGTFFGQAGDGFVRMNFACPRSRLEDGLNRLKIALDKTLAKA